MALLKDASVQSLQEDTDSLGSQALRRMPLARLLELGPNRVSDSTRGPSSSHLCLQPTIEASGKEKPPEDNHQ